MSVAARLALLGLGLVALGGCPGKLGGQQGHALV